MTQIQAPALAPAVEAEQPGVSSARIGVLIVNLGTPEGDRLLVDAALSEGISLRPARDRKQFTAVEADLQCWHPHAAAEIKGRDYDKIWNREKNELPLKTITRAQGEKLAAMLARIDARIVTDWAMRYGHPSIASRLAALTEQGCDRILILPLYPQYAAATTATVGDEVFRSADGNAKTTGGPLRAALLQ